MITRSNDYHAPWFTDKKVVCLYLFKLVYVGTNTSKEIPEITRILNQISTKDLKKVCTLWGFYSIKTCCLELSMCYL